MTESAQNGAKMAEIKGGKQLEQKLAAIAKAIGTQSKTLRVGFLAGSTYPDGTSVALVAAVQNFGAPRAGIPPRPFFTNMVRDKKAEWPKEVAAALRTNNFDADTSLKMMGDVIAGQLRQSIRDTDSPPLKPATIKRKGFDKALVDTGHMLQSVDFEITG